MLAEKQQEEEHRQLQSVMHFAQMEKDISVFHINIVTVSLSQVLAYNK